MMWLTVGAALVAVLLIYLNVQPLWVQLLAFAVALALFLMSVFHHLPTPDRVRVFLGRRVKLVIFIFALLAVNVVARNYEQVFDFSKSRIYALRASSIEQLQSVEESVEIIIFLRSHDKTIAYAEWLQEQMDDASDKITVSVKNINRDIALARKYNIDQPGDTVLVSGPHWIKVTGFQENVLMSGMARLLAQSSSTICSVVGHGEPDIVDESPTGFRAAKKLLESLGYTLKPVSLLTATTAEIRSTCSLLMIVSPRTTLHLNEQKTLEELMQSPLPIFVAVDPPASTTVTSILQRWHIITSEQLVVNEANLLKKIPLTDILLHDVPKHLLTRNISDQLYFPDTQALRTKSHESQAKSLWTSVIQTPPGLDFRVLGEDDRSGPFTIMMAREGDERTNRRVVLGSGRGFQTQHLQFGDNEQLLLNIVRWLLHEDSVAWAGDRITQERYMRISDKELTGIRMVCFYVLPGCAFLFTLGIWAKRRFS